MSIARRNKRMRQRQNLKWIEWALKKLKKKEDSPKIKMTAETFGKINRIVIEELKNKNK